MTPIIMTELFGRSGVLIGGRLSYMLFLNKKSLKMFEYTGYIYFIADYTALGRKITGVLITTEI